MRMLVPWVISVLILIPIYNVIFLYSRNLRQVHWSAYFHFTNPGNQSWLWFLPVLFLFNLVYLLLVKTKLRTPKLSVKSAVLAVSVIGFAYSFITGGILGFRSWTLTPVLDFENERLLLYFLAFLLGAFCYHRNAFAEKPEKYTLYNIVNGIAWIPVTGHIAVRIRPFFVPEGFGFTPVYSFLWWLSFNVPWSRWSMQ